MNTYKEKGIQIDDRYDNTAGHKIKSVYLVSKAM